MRIPAHFAGTVKQFRAWLAKQNRLAQIIDLAEYWEKRKTASAKAARQKSIKNIVIPILPDGAA